MTRTKFELFKEYLQKGDFDGVRNNLEEEFKEKIIENNFKKKPIHFACENGYIEIIKLLIEKECNIEIEDKNKWRPIHFACENGHVDVVKLLIDKGCCIENETSGKRKPIHYACENGHIDIVKLLIRKKCNIDSEDKSKWRSIHFACDNGHFDIVKLLTEHTDNIDCETNSRKKPIHYACENGHINIVKLLIEKKCNIESEDKDRKRPIHFACRNGHVDVVKLLIDQKCDIECETGSQKRPIHYACRNGHGDIVKLLIQNKCQIEVITEKGKKPLDLAKSNKHGKIVKLIEGFKEPRKIRNSITNDDEKAFAKFYNSGAVMIWNETSSTFWLEIALEERRFKIIQYFLNKPIDESEIRDMKNAITNDPKSTQAHLWQEALLYKSIRDHHEEWFEMICCANIINCKRKIISRSFLEVAAEEGSCVFVHEILKKSLFDRETWENAKKVALKKGHHQIYNSILERESLLKSREKANMSILHTAVCDNDPNMLEYLLKNEDLVDPNHNHEILGTALALAIILYNEKCIEVLERFNVDCNTHNKYLQTPLHEAISNQMSEYCQYLIDHTRNIDQTGFMGQTALHCAVIYDCEKLCNQLMEKGADCIRYMEFLQNSSQSKGTQFLKELKKLSRRENALTLCAKINKKIYPCFLAVLNKNKLKSSDDEGNTLLHLTANLLDPKLLNVLIRAGGEVDAINKCGRTPLFEFLSGLDQEAFNENEDKIIGMVKLFIDSQCDVTKSFQGNVTIFNIASQFNCERLLLALIPHGKNQLLGIQGNIFKIAFDKKFFRFCEAILDSFSEDRLERFINSEIIDMALSTDQTILLKTLFLHADIHLKQSVVERVLYHLAKLGDIDSFGCLLHIEVTNPQCFKNGETLLTKLLLEGKLNFCQKIFQSQQNVTKYVNLKNQKSQTALQVAIEIESMEMMQQLIFETENLNNEDCEGHTALMQMFVKISHKDDEDRKFLLLNAIKGIILGGGNIYQLTRTGVKVIQYCSKSEMRAEIEKLFKNKQNKVIVEKEVERIVETKTCQICMDRELNCVFDCGHLICQICGDTVLRCPFCGFESARLKRIYFN